MIDRDFMRECAAQAGTEVYPDEKSLDSFDLYAKMLVEWNRRMNLTAITDPDDIVCKHFADSLTLLPVIAEHKQVRKDGAPLALIDVGTGAGFPGVPLAIMLGGELRLTLLDSLNKRLSFLRELCSALGIRAELVHARAEAAGRSGEHRGKYDAATARAVAKLPVLCEYCLPFVKPGGIFIAMKGPECDDEIEQSAEVLDRLGGRISEIRRLTTTGRSGEQYQRRLIVTEKQR